MFRYERKSQKLIPRRRFLLRLFANLCYVLALVGLSLLIGMGGYHHFEGLSWLDSFENAAMILSGMGPVNTLTDTNAKLFAGFYAIYSGIAVIASSGLLLAPLLHRVIHSLHAADEQDDNESKKTKR